MANDIKENKDARSWPLGTMVKYWPGKGNGETRIGLLTRHLGDTVCLIDNKPVYYYAISMNLTKNWCNLTDFQKRIFSKSEIERIENHLKQLINE